MKDLDKKILSHALLELTLEALDFSNIKPYEVSRDGTFETEFGNGRVKMADYTEFVESGEHFEFPEVVTQSFDFYKRNKPQHAKIYNLFYTIDGLSSQAKKTSYKDLIKILVTVISYAKKFVEKEQPFGVMVFSQNKNVEDTIEQDSQKMSIYNRIITTNLPTGYSFSEVKVTNNTGKIIYRKTLPNK